MYEFILINWVYKMALKRDRIPVVDGFFIDNEIQKYRNKIHKAYTKL